MKDLRNLVLINISILGGAVFLGIVFGWNSAGLFTIQEPKWMGFSSALQDFVRISLNNLFLASLALAGALTFGTMSLAIVIWNGLFLGFNLPAIAALGIQEAGYLSLYLPLEFLGICMAATVGESTGWWLLCSLIRPHHAEFGNGKRAAEFAITSALLILAAAGLETTAKIIRNYGT